MPIPTIHNRKLIDLVDEENYFILLPDQTVLIGPQFELMRVWKLAYMPKKIEEMDRAKFNVHGIPFSFKGRRYNVTITTLSNFIDSYNQRSA